MQNKIDARAAFALSSHGIKPEDLAQNLGRDLPGILSVDITSPRDGHVETLLESRAPSGEVLYDWRVNFDLASKTGAIKNFSIHHAANKGLNIGTTAIRNLLQVGTAHSENAQGENAPLDRITLSGELERGAWVWARMGWLPEETSFRRFQKKVQPKLEALEQVLPAAERLDPQAYALFHTLLDPVVSKNPALVWPMVDSGLSYDTEALAELRGIMQHPRDDERHDLLRGYLQKNRPDQADISDTNMTKLDKNLRFMRDIDLEGMSRNGRMNTSLLLFSWERWEGSLSFTNPEQMNRLNTCLQKFEARQAVQPKTRNIFIPEQGALGYERP